MQMGHSDAGDEILLSTGKPDRTFSNSDWLILRADGLPSAERAGELGQVCRKAVMLAMASLRMAGDLGDRAPKGWIARFGLEMLEDQCGQRFLNDIHGLMVFESEPRPRFASVGAPTLSVARRIDEFKRAFTMSLPLASGFSKREEAAFTLYSSAAFQRSQYARFLLLVMAVESLIVLERRGAHVLEYVERLVAQTKSNSALSASERDSLVASLEETRRESIRAAGRRLADERLDGTKFDGQSAAAFWGEAYTLRSRLVHGNHPLPTSDEVGKAAAQLEVFVALAISRPYLDGSKA